MKLAMYSIIVCLSLSLNAQNKDWLTFENEKTIRKVVLSSEVFRIQQLTFNIKWDDQLSYNENSARHYGGISEMKIYYKNSLLQTINKLEDKSALDEIVFTFYDFNMDGSIDFSIRSKCGKSCYYDYYLYNTNKNEFIHNVLWDGIRIYRLNKKTKQILTQPDGTATYGESHIYKIKDENLFLLKTIKYGNQ